MDSSTGPLCHRSGLSETNVKTNTELYWETSAISYKWSDLWRKGLNPSQLCIPHRTWRCSAWLVMLNRVCLLQPLQENRPHGEHREALALYKRWLPPVPYPPRSWTRNRPLTICHAAHSDFSLANWTKGNTVTTQVGFSWNERVVQISTTAN